MTSLITGGNGIIGSELAHLLVEAGEEVVLFSRNLPTKRIKDIHHKVKCIQGDLGIASHIFDAVKSNKITEIYHMGAMLTFASEADPHGSFQTNMIGTINVMEAARLFGVEKIMFASSIATFGLEAGETITDTTIQRPVFFYGIGKLFGEGLGRYYRNKYGLDSRCIRYPAVIGPGVKTPGHWIPPMIEDAMLDRPHESPVSEDATSWIISLKDAAKAAFMLLKASREEIKMVNYNVTGCTPAIKAKEIAAVIRRYKPEAVIRFKHDSNNPQLFKGYKGNYDDSCARKEWGWNPAHYTLDLIYESFINNMKSNPERYMIS
jgi:nucleoside-diphosphate-sugar epimerase